MYFHSYNAYVASFPGSPLAPTKNKNWARGEPGNEANAYVVKASESMNAGGNIK